MSLNAQIEASLRRGVPPAHLSVSDIVRASWAAQPSPTHPSSPSEFSEAPSEYSIKSSTNKYLQNRGRISSRTQRRLNNDNFKDNPMAVLNPKDLIPPGFNLSTPSFHFRHKYAEPRFLVTPRVTRSPKASRPLLDRWLRKKLQVVPITRNILPNLEMSLRDFLETCVGAPCVSSERKSVSKENTDIDESWDKLTTEAYLSIKEEYESDFDAVLISNPRIELHPSCESAQLLICSLSNSFHRLILHTLCSYYGIISYSRDDPLGYRSVVVCPPGFCPNLGTFVESTWEYPEKSFFDFLFED
ncbi:hypothetical protein DSO57_1028628 [Entomophthora muscae]|uniref:Uncharacterized protein n=1 Tax=Entomophthora muscae TaxID=34485 RepID=A0ACC2TCL6_9FUNG|nr:hypothetical protein DSO57_1028628 [Entomophthora muscae]